MLVRAVGTWLSTIIAISGIFSVQEDDRLLREALANDQSNRAVAASTWQQGGSDHLNTPVIARSKGFSEVQC